MRRGEHLDPRDDQFDERLAAAQAGDERAVAELYRDMQPRLSGYLRAGNRAAEDIEGEVWLAIAKGLARFTGGEDAFRAWIFSIAQRRLADFRRTAARRATVPVAPETLDRPSTDGGPESLVLESFSSDEASAFVTATLSPDQAEVILLRVIGGLDVDQVAELLGKRPGTIRVLQHRGLRRLQAELAKGRVTR